MHGRGIPLDVVSIADELKKRGDFEAVGAEPYLTGPKKALYNSSSLHNVIVIIHIFQSLTNYLRHQ